MDAFDLDSVPRDPEAAYAFLTNYLLDHWREYFTNDQLNVGGEATYSAYLKVFRYVIRKRKPGKTRDYLLHYLEATLSDNLDESKDAASRVRRHLSELRQGLEDRVFKDHFDGGATFKLDGGEIDKIADLAADIKRLIRQSDLFKPDHKRRLISRVLKIEEEIYKSKGNYQVVLDGVDDFGKTLGRFGINIKPIFDRAREIQSIILPHTSSAPQLGAPDEIKLLPAPDDPGGPIE
jgi:hypothetical protein